MRHRHPPELPDLTIFEPEVYADRRGFFLETWQADRYTEHGLDVDFVQDNHSRSHRGVLRGLHFQHPHAQGKLIRVARGAVLDVAVDVRLGSPTFGRHLALRLDDEDHRQLWVPSGFAHGFAVLSDEADVLYFCDEFYRPDAEHTLAWDDSEIAVDWPVASPILSEKDSDGQALSELRSRGLLPKWQGAN